MSFFTDRVTRLTPGTNDRHQHFFGGPPRHQGAVPEGQAHPVTLLYDLDLTDPDHGLVFSGLTRLPLYNALQYNCCDMVYRVISDDRIEIISPIKERWDVDIPFESYPPHFERVPVIAEPLSHEDYKTTVFAYTVNRAPFAGGGVPEPDAARLRELRYPFAQIGGVQFMWQGEPQWKCPNRECKNFAKDCGKQVFAVIWEAPIPGIDLWNPPSDAQETPAHSRSSSPVASAAA